MTKRNRIKVNPMTVGEVSNLIRLAKKFDSKRTESVFSAIDRTKILTLRVFVNMDREDALIFKKFAKEHLNIPVIIQPIKGGIEVSKSY